MILQDVLAALETITPLRYAEAWDNVGLLTGDPAAPIERVLLTIDLTHAVLDEAIARRADLVVAYHPALFEAIKRVRHDSVLYRAIRASIAVWTPHTALDVAAGGTNDVLADALGITERAPLRVTSAAENVGIGRIGTLADAPTRAALLDRIKDALGVQAVLVAGPLEGVVRRAAVCAGAGRGLLDDVIKQKAELYLTGELPHHDALKAAAAGLTVVCVLHSNSERAALRTLQTRIEAAAPGVVVALSEVDRDPYTVNLRST
ncbi:MAG: Nif3-like dinuclear metal center hexameric protein [Byssovorax sp.]